MCMLIQLDVLWSFDYPRSGTVLMFSCLIGTLGSIFFSPGTSEVLVDLCN